MVVRATSLALSLILMGRLMVEIAHANIVTIIFGFLIFMWLTGSVLLCLGDDSAHFMVDVPLCVLLACSLFALLVVVSHDGAVFSETGRWGFTDNAGPFIGLVYIFSALLFGLGQVRRRLRSIDARHGNDVSKVNITDQLMLDPPPNQIILLPG